MLVYLVGRVLLTVDGDGEYHLSESVNENIYG